MGKPSYVYVTYIASTPEKVFDALTNPEMTRRYWFNHRNASDWRPGSRWQHQDYDDATHVDIVGRVVEISPPTRLVVTWADPAEEADAGRASRVTYEVVPIDSGSRLTVTHEELEAGSEMEKGITYGWPVVLSNLKTLLETGAPMVMHFPHEATGQKA